MPAMLRVWLLGALVVVVGRPWWTEASPLMDAVCNAEHPLLFCGCQLPGQLDCALLGREEASAEEWDQLWANVTAEAAVEELKISGQAQVDMPKLPPSLLTPRLRLLFVRHTPLSHLTPKLLAVRSPNLQQLDLSSNRIHRLQAHSLSQLNQLKELTLSDNQMTRLSEGALRPLPALRLLFLDRNNLTEVSVDDLPSLTELDLSANALTELQPNSLRRLPSLRRLDLSGNQLRQLTADALSGCPSLRDLLLRDNRLHTIHPQAFQGATQLQSLFLSRNQLTAIAPATFRPLRQLLYLDLRSNRLSSLDARALVHPNHTRIYLADNQLVCDCGLRWMLELWRLRKEEAVNEWREVSCLPPLPPQLQADQPASHPSQPLALEKAAHHFTHCPPTAATTTPEATQEVEEQLVASSTPVPPNPTLLLAVAALLWSLLTPTNT